MTDENAHDLTVEAVKGKLASLTSKDESVAAKMATTFSALSKLADFKDPLDSKATQLDEEIVESSALPPKPASLKGQGLAFSHVVYINLPATHDVAVYNAIFKSIGASSVTILDALRGEAFKALTLQAEIEERKLRGELLQGGELATAQSLLGKYAEFFSLQLRTRCERMAYVYALFYCFENIVRDLVAQRLEERKGEECGPALPITSREELTSYPRRF